MMIRWRARMNFRAAGLVLILSSGTGTFSAQQVDGGAILQKIDAAVKARVDGIAAYTATEHYAVFRSKDQIHPVAEMTVKTTYKKETGKSYAIVSETGSTVVRNLVLHAILENEKHVNEPGVREGAWITTANYQMQVKPVGILRVDGRDCVALVLTPRRKELYLLEGTLWVDAKDGKIVQIEGKATKSSSVFTGATQMARQYMNVEGFAQATHARAQSDSYLFGQTVVKIDYQDYQVQLEPGP